MPTKKSSSDRLKEIATRLMITRDILGLSQKEISEQLNLASPVRWGHWERGRNMPDPEAISNLCDRYGITMDWIYRGDISGLTYSFVEKAKVSSVFSKYSNFETLLKTARG